MEKDARLFNCVRCHTQTIICRKCDHGQIYLLISSYRSKYENLTTPYGTINLNWQQLKDDGNTLLQQVAEKLDMMPPDHLIEFF